jgi:hypothetical protein
MTRQIIIGLALSLALAASSFGAPQDAGTPRIKSERQITIRIHNYAKVKPSVLLPAERAAADMFRVAGVDSIWVECLAGQTELAEAACTSPMTPLVLVLNLLPRSMAQRLHFRDEVFGVAMENTGKDFGFFASVFYDNVKDCAVQRRLDFAAFGRRDGPRACSFAAGHKLTLEPGANVRLLVPQETSRRRTARPVFVIFRNEAASYSLGRSQASRPERAL